MGLEGTFEVVVGYEDSAGHKPAPDPFLVCLERLSLTGGDAIAIGDRPFDILGARAAGIRGAAGVWGANDSEALLGALPDIVLTTPNDITTLL